MRPRRFFSYLVLAGLALLWAGALRDSHNTRYRVTVEIETPEGVRTGSSVVEVALGNVAKALIGMSANDDDHVKRREA